MLDVKVVSSKDVPNTMVQDGSQPMVIIGMDVVSLYPTLKWKVEVLESDMKWEGVNWNKGSRYLALVRGYTLCKSRKLRRGHPDWRYAHGSWSHRQGPSVTS